VLPLADLHVFDGVSGVAGASPSSSPSASGKGSNSPPPSPRADKAEAKPEKSLPFEIKSSMESWVLAAETAAERTAWLSALREQIEIVQRSKASLRLSVGARAET